MADSELIKTSLNKAMAVCSRREYCIDDINKKLETWGVGINDSQKILAILIRENFINETRYANAFVRDKFKYNKWGKVKIAAHLKRRKIPASIINSALDSIDNESYTGLIRDLIEGHKKHVKAKNSYELKAKLLRYGLSKGYESSILYDILNDLPD
jgi:regulatory protein